MSNSYNSHDDLLSEDEEKFFDDEYINKNKWKQISITSNSHEFKNRSPFPSIIFDVNKRETNNTSKVYERNFIEKQEDTKEIQKKKTIKFIVIKKKKRGREKTSLSKLKKPHKANDKDNISTKLKVHMLTFGKSLANDAKNSCTKSENNFFKIAHKKKREIKIQELIEKNEEKEYIFKYNMIFKLRVSLKNKGIKKFANSEEELEKMNINNEPIYNSILKDNHDYSILEKFFDQGFMDIIDKYYLLNKKECNNEFYYENLKIELSQKTKTFWDLLEKIENKHDKNKYINVLKTKFNLEPLKKEGNKLDEN